MNINTNNIKTNINGNMMNGNTNIMNYTNFNGQKASPRYISPKNSNPNRQNIIYNNFNRPTSSNLLLNIKSFTNLSNFSANDFVVDKDVLFIQEAFIN
jgi:hypothetical protein